MLSWRFFNSIEPTLNMAHKKEHKMFLKLGRKKIVKIYAYTPIKKTVNTNHLMLFILCIGWFNHMFYRFTSSQGRGTLHTLSSDLSLRNLG